MRIESGAILNPPPRYCPHYTAYDLAELVTNPPPLWEGLATLGAVKGEDLAALRQPGLVEYRKFFDFVQPVPSGTYDPPIEASMLLSRSDFLHPVPQEIEAAHAPLDLSAYIQPGDRLAVKQITMIKQFNKVVIQPWAEPGTELGQLLEAFWETVEMNRDMQETCLRNPPVLKPIPGLLGAVRRGEGQNRRWCRVKVIFLNVFKKLFACSKENIFSNNWRE